MSDDGGWVEIIHDPSIDLGGAAYGQRRGWGGWIAVGLAVSVFVGFLIGALIGGGDDAQPGVATPAEPLATPEPGPTPEAIATEGPAVRLVLDVSLQSRIVLAPVPLPSGDGQPLWIVEANRLSSNPDVATFGGDFRYPLLFAGNDVVFPGSDGPQTVSDDMVSIDAPFNTDFGDYVISSGRPGEVFVVGRIGGRPSRLTRFGDSTTVTQFVDGLHDIIAGVAEGLIGRTSILPSASNDLAYWRPGLPLAKLDSLAAAATDILTTSDDLLAAFEPGTGVVVVDVGVDERILEIAAAERPIYSCFSPDNRYLALTLISPRRIELFDLIEPTSRRLTFAGRPVNGLTWTGETELIALVADKVLRIEVPAMQGRVAVELSGPTGWWIASEAATC